jgi:exodeoxyribonuclease VII large subunit
MLQPQPQRIFSVTDLTKSIKGILESSFNQVTVVGEVSNLRQPYSGHLYFTLKDEGAQLRAVFFKMQQRYSLLELTDGLQIICRGRISIYEARGEYQLIVDTVEQYGLGRLQLQFEELKKRLLEEGLFAEDHKKPLPFFPARIALVTSPTGAAIHDFLQAASLRFRHFPIVIAPVRVQGTEAAAEIAAALDLINASSLADVIVLCRGGGSIEDLWPFNEERVARAIYHSAIPVVSGIGHETDFTIADFVADFRALTPTAAAEATVPFKKDLVAHLNRLTDAMARAQKNHLDSMTQRLKLARKNLSDPASLITRQMLRLDHQTEKLLYLMRFSLQSKSRRLHSAALALAQQQPEQKIMIWQQKVEEIRRRMEMAMQIALLTAGERHKKATQLLMAVSPKAILQRGYAIVRRQDGTVLRDAAMVRPQELVDILLHKGRLKATVQKISKKK